MTNIEQLVDALSGHDPDPDAVLRSVRGKRQRARNRMLAASGGAAAVVLAVVAGVALQEVNFGGPAASSSSGVAVPGAPTGHAAGPGGSLHQNAAAGSNSRASGASPGPAATSPGASCSAVPLRDALAAAIRGGASVIIATGTLTGKAVAAAGATGGTAPGDGATYYAMTLQSVQVLRGPAVASGSTAWVPGPAAGTSATAENSVLLAPGGRLFAIVWPKSATHDPVGPTLRLAPVVGADVVVSPHDCWDLTGLQPGRYQQSTPLRPVPGGANYGGANQGAEDGLNTVPLATVEQIAASA